MNLPLKYPEYKPRIKQSAGSTFIFDFIRKKWLILTPEEWVRQHLLNYLVNEKNYRASSIAIEKELQLNDLKKRFDIVVYDAGLNPFMIIECKAPYIGINDSVLEQVLRYNLVVKARYVMISNGIQDFVFNQFKESVEIPEYPNPSSNNQT